jgi:preprotein translocase subunit SecG
VKPYLNVALIIVAIALTTAILIQARGSGLGGVFGGDTSVYTQRRGVEKTLFQVTIGLGVVFFLLTMANVLVR